LQQKNPDYWKAYALAGNYYYKNQFYAAALDAFQKASRLEITTLPARQRIEKRIEKLKRKCR
jgi:tetratricopeptide (TPR) repeat protein